MPSYLAPPPGTYVKQTSVACVFVLKLKHLEPLDLAFPVICFKLYHPKSAPTGTIATKIKLNKSLHL